MAFVSSPLPQEQQNQFAPTGQTTPNPLGMLPPQAAQTGGSAGQGGGSGGGTAPSVGSPTQFGSAASRLSDYLAANQQQTQQMANNIAGNFNTQYGNQQGEIQGLGQQFGQAVQGGYTAPDQAMVDQALANASGFAQNPQNVSAFQAQLNDQYTGPANVENYQPYAGVQQDVQNAVQNAGLVNTYPGLSTYLNQNTQGLYTPGMNTLDTTLLQANQPAYQTITGAANQFNALPGQLSGVVTQGDQSVQAAQAAAPQAAQYATQGLNTATANENQTLQNLLNQAQGAYSTYNTDVGQLRGAAGDINTQIQQYLANNPNITVSGNTDFLAPWVNLQQDTTAPTLGTVAAPQDYATLQALNTLSGGKVPITSPLDLTQSSQAGTFALPQDLQAAISNQAVPSAMRNELGAISNQITSAYAPFQQAEQSAYNYGTLGAPAAQALKLDQSNLTQAQAALQNLQSNPQTNPSDLQAAQAQVNQLQAQVAQDQATVQANPYASWDAVAPIGAGLQWLPQASTQYNNLITQLQADMQGLGGMQIPNYQVPAPGMPASQQAGNAAGIAAGAGTGAASLTPAMAGVSGADIASGSPAIMDTAGLSVPQAIGPAALAAYGTTNIVQNELANPTQNGLATLANMGLTLGTLSLPPKILDSIGSGISDVMNSIGSFFGGLF